MPPHCVLFQKNAYIQSEKSPYSAQTFLPEIENDYGQ